MFGETKGRPESRPRHTDCCWIEDVFLIAG